MKVMILGNTVCLENAYSMHEGISKLKLDGGFFGYRSFAQKYSPEKARSVIMELIRKNKPGWIFVQYQFSKLITPDWFKEMKQINPKCKISLMSVDIRGHLDESTLKASKHVDVCFQKGKKDLYIKEGVNCKILQQGYSDLLFYKVKNIKKEYDLCFAGGHYKGASFPGTLERVSTMNYLSRVFPKLTIIGKGWDKIVKPSQQQGHMDLRLINNIYNKTKVTLNINHYNNIKHYFSVRMIEGMASGSMMLTRYIPGLELYFENHKDLVWFYSLSDCVDLAKYYIKNDKERENIAINGLNKVQKYFRWEKIMQDAFHITFNNKRDHEDGF